MYLSGKYCPLLRAVTAPAGVEETEKSPLLHEQYQEKWVHPPLIDLPSKTAFFRD